MRGSIYFHKELQFPNGEKGTKLLVQVNTPSKNDPHLLVRTTSEERKLLDDRIICDAEDGWNAVIKNYLYLPGSLRTELRKMDELGKPILNNIQQNRPVADAQFERFTQQLKVLKDKMVSEIEDDTSVQTLLK